jgi:hypothetical protein
VGFCNRDFVKFVNGAQEVHGMFEHAWTALDSFWLVVTGTIEFYDFPDIGNVIIPTDFHSIIVQDGYCTTNQGSF